MVTFPLLAYGLAFFAIIAASPVGDRRSTIPSTATPLGCYTDGTPRTLNGSSTSSGTMTVAYCASYCTTKGFLYAGMEYATQCYCGNILSTSKKTTDTKCTMACSGDKSTTCGGSYLLNVYSLESSTTSTSNVKITSTTISSKTTTTTSKISTTSRPLATSPASSTSRSTSTASNASKTTATASSSTLTTTKPITPTTASTRISSTPAATSSTTRTVTLSSTITTPKITTSSGTSTAASISSPATHTSSAASIATGSTAKTSFSSSPTFFTSSTASISALSRTTTSANKTMTTTSRTSSSVITSASSPCIGACSSVIGVAAPPAASGTKSLYAHHIVGNTASFTQATWEEEIGLAESAGIDGFALNIGADPYEVGSVANAYAAAKAAGSFKLFLSLDLTSLPCWSNADAANTANLISTYASHPNQATHSNKTLVSTFSGDSCTFGQSSVNAGWTYLRSLLTVNNVTIYLIPSIFADPSTFSSMSWMDGELNWNSGWPSGASSLDGSSDTLYMSALGNKTYMPAISPAFFTYYGPNSWNKDWIYRSDDWLLATRMEMVMSMRNKVEFAEIISWNDYGESHYIGPVRADQPNSQGWTDGMSHTAWLSLIAYYAPAFKTGSYPTPSDNLWLWSRPHPKDATPTVPSNPKPSGWNYTDDNLYAFVTLASPANVTINSGTNNGTWSLPAGVSKLSLASVPGSIGGRIVRGNTTLKSYNSSGSFSYVATPVDYNFNYFVAQA